MTVRAVRGAVSVERDEPRLLRAQVAHLFEEILRRNGLSQDDLISVLFTTTPDLVSGFPAAAVRDLGGGEIPLMCAQEIDVPGALPGVVRVLAHVSTDRPRAEIEHVYLGGAAALRPDLAPGRLPSGAST